MKRPDAVLIHWSFVFFAIIATVSAGVCTAQHAAEPQGLTPQVLQADSRLQRVVHLHFHQERLDDALKALSQETGVMLSVTADLAARRLTGRSKDKSAGSFMLALERVLGVSWHRMERGYELFQTEEQQRMERWRRRGSEEREKEYLRAQTEELRGQVSRALLQGGNDREVFADFLANVDSAEMERGLSSALEDEPILSAVDQSHFHNHLFGVKPFSTLLPSQQNAVSRIAYDGGYRSLSGTSGIGLIAAAGGFRLGIIQPDGRDVWVSPRHAIGGVAGLNANTRENDFDYNVASQMKSGAIADLRQLSYRLQQRKFRIKQTTAYLSTLLEDVCGVADIDFVCDCYLNSSTSNYGFVFPRDSEWTVATALTQMARTFAHRMIYRDGYLEASTAIPGLDLRLEPPAEVMNALDAEAKAQLPPNRNDLLLMSKCTKDQIALLVIKHPVARISIHLINALRTYRFLHFLGMLSKEQQSKALSDNGIGTVEMNVRQREAFHALCAIGLPQVTTMKLKKSRFYVKSTSAMLVDHGRHREILSFIATMADDATHCRSGDL